MGLRSERLGPSWGAGADSLVGFTRVPSLSFRWTYKGFPYCV